MPVPYRELVPAPASADATLECWLRDGDRKRWLRAVYVKLTMSLAGSVMLAPAGLRFMLIPLGIGAVWAYRDVQQRNGARVELRIVGDRLQVAASSKGKRGAIDLALDELLEVRLDSKSASKNVTMARADGVNTVFGMSSNHNIEVDIARIELVPEGRAPILLDPDFISASLCSDALRSIRLFLRAHGWKPADERKE